jgi:3-oxoacyl-[acyl-carrier protein] reductase
MKLENKVVVVTGASRNLGRTIAVECATRGADVVVNYCNSESEAKEVVAEIQSLGRRSVAIKADVGEYAQADELLKQVVTDFGRVDVLVNNAGVLRRSLLMMMEPGEFEHVVRTNLLGSFHGTKAVSRHMIKQRGGCIVNVSSLAGQRGWPGQGAYSASKAGVDSLTTSAAKELARYGIRVNGVAPGPIWTPLIPATGWDDERIRTFGSDTPLGRAGQPAELAGAYVYLASEESSYTSGSIVAVTGGKPL